MSVSNKPILITAEASKYPKIQAFLEEKKIPHIFESLISLEFKPFKVPENTSWIFSSSPNIFNTCFQIFLVLESISGVLLGLPLNKN